MGVLRRALNWYARLSPVYGPSKPPFNHVIQIGDPTLRKISQPVPVDKIKSEEVQKVISKLNFVMKKYKCLGMSAPQIGVNMRIFAIHHSVQDVASMPPEIVKKQEIYPVPFSVVVNPILKVIDYKKVVFSEGCESVKGYEAEVPRYREVEISGYNEKAEEITTRFKGWPARIVQHELDHLDGKVYIDIMENKTLQCVCWEQVNLSKGKITIPFGPS